MPKTVLQLLGDDYLEHVGFPYKFSYSIDGKLAKSLVELAGIEVVRRAWIHLLTTDDDWLKNFKTIPDLSKYFNRLCASMQESEKKVPTESLEKILSKAEISEKEQQDRYDEMLGEE